MSNTTNADQLPTGIATEAEVKKFLILSLKWSKTTQLLVWYAPESKGYTTSILNAGQFTESEAREHEGHGDTLAVPYAVADHYAVRGVPGGELNNVISRAKVA